MKIFRPLRLLVPMVAVLAALALFVGVGFLFLGGGGGSAGCAQVTGAVGGQPSGPRDANGLTEEQRQNASLIIGVAKSMNLPPRAWQVALATAMQESGLRNVNYGDRDSLGLFQQRPSQGWGTAAQVTDPTYATTTFLQRLTKIPDWEQLPVTVAAQLVQRSAFPDAYARWEGLAAALVQQLAGVADIIGCAITGALPEGVVRTVVSFAMGELGKPYLWGGTGPNAYDCSGLMLRAFQAAGINLPRVAADQFQAGAHVPVTQAQAGDLLFLATDTSDPATIHHVMLYLGNGTVVEAPRRGVPIRTRLVSWTEREMVQLATRPGTMSTRA